MEIDPVLEITPGADPADPSTWAWEDISTYARGAFAIKRGRADEESRPTPSTLSIRLNNVDGRFSRLNPTSPYFGLLALNTPIRASLRRARDGFDRTVAAGWGAADTGQAWGIADVTLDPATFAVDAGWGRITVDEPGFGSARPTATLTGLDVRDVEVRGRIRATAVATTGAGTGTYTAGLVARYVDVDNFVHARAQFTTGGTVEIDLLAVASGSAATFSPVVDTGYTYTAGDEFHVRCLLYRSRMAAKVWPVGDPEPTWQVEAEVPADSPRRGAVGCSAARFPANTNTNLPVEFDDIEALSIRFTGHVAEWPPHVGGPNEDEVAIAASGALRRLQRDEAYSVARWTIESLEPHSYWPMEDPAGSPSFASAVAGIPAATIVQQQRVEYKSPLRLAADSSAAGSEALPMFEPVVGGHFPSVGDMTGLWTIALAFRHDVSDDAPSSWEFDTLGIYAGDSNTRLVWGNVGVRLTGTFSLEYDWDDAFTPDTSLWHTVVLQIDTPASGAWTATIIADGVPLVTGPVNTSPPTLGRIRHLYAPAQTSTLITPSIGHVAIWQGHPDIAATYHRAIVEGFAGETAEERLARLADTGRVATTIATPTHPEATDDMGPQQVGAVPDLLDEVEQTNRGLAFEGLDGALTMVTRADLYAAAQATPITADARTGIQPGLDIQDDDQGTVNTATAKNASGAEATVTDAASVARIGIYPDAVQVNTLDDQNQLRSIAGWEVARSAAAREHERYPAVPLNLNRDETLLAEWMAEDPIGRPLHLTGIQNVSPGTKRQLIEGYTETWDAVEATADANCTPLAAWDAVELGDADTGRVDTSGSHLAPAGLYLPGAAGAYASTPSDAALNITGPMRVRAYVSRASWSAPAAEQVIAARYMDSTDNRSWYLSYHTNGLLRFIRSADGTTGTVVVRAATAGLPVASGDLALEVLFNPATGDITFATAPTADGPWTPLGDVVPSPATGAFAATADLEVGARDGGAVTPWEGAIYAVEVHDVTGGDDVAAPDFTTHTPGTGAFVDATGRTWTIHGDAYVTGSIDAGDTSIQVTTDPGAAVWTTDPADLPLTIRVDGEVMTVTAVTGGTSPQTMTVVRGDDAAAHAAGAELRLARTPRVVL